MSRESPADSSREAFGTLFIGSAGHHCGAFDFFCMEVMLCKFYVIINPKSFDYGYAMRVWAIIIMHT